MCRLTEGVLKQFGFQKAEHHSMICHDWLGPRHVLIGTKVGKILIMEDAELKTSVDIINLIDNSHLISNSSMSESETADVKIKSAERREISALISFKGGFICSLGSGRAVIVETQISKEDEEVKLQVTQMIRLPTRNATTAGTWMSADTASGSKIIAMALNNSETTLIALTDTLQLMSFAVKNNKGKNEFQVFNHSFHNGSITGVDVCQRKPLVVTCGIDRSIKVWNYLTLELELSKEFEESVESVALHPTGNYVLAGFSDKLRLMNLLIDDIKTFREFQFKNSTSCCFSCGGHLLAAVSHNKIGVYSSVDFENIVNLIGHDGKVTSITWSNDDQYLVSCAEDGSLYQWDVADGKRTYETVLKQCSFSGVSMAPDNSGLIYAVGSDKTIKQFKGSQVLKEIDLHTITLSSVVLSHEGSMLFTGSTTGRIQSFKFPLTLPGEWLEYKIHGDIITQMKLALDDNRLITASRDGSLCFWQVKTSAGAPPVRKDLEFSYAGEILITKSELEDKNKLVFTLQQQVDETKTESEYQLKLKDNKYVEEARIAKKKFNADISDLKQSIHRLENDITSIKKDHSTAMAQVMEDNEKNVAEISEQFKSKLIVEYQKYANLEDKYNQVTQAHKKKMENIEKSRADEFKKMQAEFDAKLVKNQQEVKRHEKIGNEKVRAVEEMLKQTEEDADKEILELKTKYEKILRGEREANVRLRGETGIIRKKLQSVMKDTEEYKQNIGKMTTENQKLHTTIKNMEKDIMDLKNEIRNRDETIGDKEKMITELKRTGIELEKNRFVLEHKIENLKQQILPKDDLIRDLRGQIDAMEDELNAVTRTQADLEVTIDETKTKLTSTSQELMTERKRASNLTVLQARLFKDINILSNVSQDAKSLREAVANMCKKYIKHLESSGATTTMEDESETKNALEEIMRQKAFLERSVSSLKNQMEKERKNHKQEYFRKLRENAFLLEEIAELKKELIEAKKYQLPSQVLMKRRTSSLSRSVSSGSGGSRGSPASPPGSAER